MAKETLTIITDDIDGSKDAQTVVFSLEGTDYSVDLSNKNLKKLRDALAPYIEAGDKVTRRRATKKATSGKTPSAEIRAWALSNGIDTPARGRIPQAVIDAYEAAN